LVNIPIKNRPWGDFYWLALSLSKCSVSWIKSERILEKTPTPTPKENKFPTGQAFRKKFPPRPRFAEAKFYASFAGTVH
jgi:hypothetical protein